VPSGKRETISVAGWKVAACSTKDEISSGRSCINPIMVISPF
jgi:hypothetical protein